MSLFEHSINCEDCNGHGSVSGSTCSTCNGKGKVARGTTFRRDRDDSLSTMAAMDPLGLLNPISPLNLALHAGNTASVASDPDPVRNDTPAAPAAAPVAAPAYSAPDTNQTFSTPDSAPSMPTDL